MERCAQKLLGKRRCSLPHPIVWLLLWVHPSGESGVNRATQRRVADALQSMSTHMNIISRKQQRGSQARQSTPLIVPAVTDSEVLQSLAQPYVGCRGCGWCTHVWHHLTVVICCVPPPRLQAWQWRLGSTWCWCRCWSRRRHGRCSRCRHAATQCTRYSS